MVWTDARKRYMKTLCFVLCGCCLLMTIAFNYRSYSLRRNTGERETSRLYDNFLHEQILWRMFNDNSTHSFMNLSEVAKFSGNHTTTTTTTTTTKDTIIHAKTSSIPTPQKSTIAPTVQYSTWPTSTTSSNSKLLESVKVDLAIASLSVSTLTTTSSAPDPVTTVPDYIVNGHPQRCDACLYGRKLTTVQEGWICGQPRLGNKMSMIAAPYIAALQQNAEYVMIHNTSRKCEWLDWLRDIFPNIRKLPSIAANITASWPNTGESGFTSYTEIYITKNITSAGFRQSWQYMPRDSDLQVLRILFALDDKYRVPAIGRLKEAAEYYNVTAPVYIGVHMRMGDLNIDRNVDYGYQMANSSYYQRAFHLMLKLLEGNSKDIIFTIATDSLNDADRILSSLPSNMNLFWLKQAEYVDFSALSMCNHTIISGGTYGLWAAILSGGTTIYHDNFARFNTSFGETYCSKCFNRPTWIPL